MARTPKKKLSNKPPLPMSGGFPRPVNRVPPSKPKPKKKKPKTSSLAIYLVGFLVLSLFLGLMFWSAQAEKQYRANFFALCSAARLRPFKIDGFQKEHRQCRGTLDGRPVVMDLRPGGPLGGGGPRVFLSLSPGKFEGRVHWSGLGRSIHYEGTKDVKKTLKKSFGPSVTREVNGLPDSVSYISVKNPRPLPGSRAKKLWAPFHGPVLEIHVDGDIDSGSFVRVMYRANRVRGAVDNARYR